MRTTLATFSHDYSADGIPSAPNSTNGTTRGLKLESNVSSGTFTGLSVSPTGRDFTGDYRLRFDLWINYNGPLNGGGFGSTQAATAGVGTKGETPQWPGGTPDSAFFAVTGDGGSSTDYRAYISGGASLAPNTGAYAAGTGTAPDSRNNLHPYYGEFGREAAPEAQLALHPNQTGTTTVGAAGVAWRDVVITRTGASLTWSIDGLPIASIDTTSLNLSTNIFLGYFDTSASLSDNVAMSFGLIDNVRVESLTGPVEPPVITITRVELLPDNRVRILFSATGTATQFAVESAASLTGAFGQEATADIQLLRAGPPSGDFAAVVAASGPMRFYRVKTGFLKVGVRVSGAAKEWSSQSPAKSEIVVNSFPFTRLLRLRLVRTGEETGPSHGTLPQVPKFSLTGLTCIRGQRNNVQACDLSERIL